MIELHLHGFLLAVILQAPHRTLIALGQHVRGQGTSRTALECGLTIAQVSPTAPALVHTCWLLKIQLPISRSPSPYRLPRILRLRHRHSHHSNRPHHHHLGNPDVLRGNPHNPANGHQVGRNGIPPSRNRVYAFLSSSVHHDLFNKRNIIMFDDRKTRFLR